MKKKGFLSVLLATAMLGSMVAAVPAAAGREDLSGRSSGFQTGYSGECIQRYRDKTDHSRDIRRLQHTSRHLLNAGLFLS